MDVIIALSGVSTMLAAVAAWAGFLSPRARDRRIHQNAQQRREVEIHQALYGIPARHDDSGALIDKGKPGLLATVEAISSLPILNGKGSAALARIDELDVRSRRIDARTIGYGKRLSAIEKALGGNDRAKG